MTDERAFDVETVASALAVSGRPYHEFLRSPSLSAGLYVLAAGKEDRQRPHTEDEIYVVLDGRSRFRTGEMEVDVRAGSIFFVPAAEPHRFLDITQTLRVAVIFAPPEGSAQPG